MRSQTFPVALSWLFFVAALLISILGTCAAAYRWTLPLGLSDLTARGEDTSSISSSSMPAETSPESSESIYQVPSSSIHHNKDNKNYTHHAKNTTKHHEKGHHDHEKHDKSVAHGAKANFSAIVASMSIPLGSSGTAASSLANDASSSEILSSTPLESKTEAPSSQGPEVDEDDDYDDGDSEDEESQASSVTTTSSTISSDSTVYTTAVSTDSSAISIFTDSSASTSVTGQPYKRGNTDAEAHTGSKLERLLSLVDKTTTATSSSSSLQAHDTTDLDTTLSLMDERTMTLPPFPSLQVREAEALNHMPIHRNGEPQQAKDWQDDPGVNYRTVTATQGMTGDAAMMSQLATMSRRDAQPEQDNAVSLSSDAFAEAATRMATSETPYYSDGHEEGKRADPDFEDDSDEDDDDEENDEAERVSARDEELEEETPDVASTSPLDSTPLHTGTPFVAQPYTKGESAMGKREEVVYSPSADVVRVLRRGNDAIPSGAEEL